MQCRRLTPTQAYARLLAMRNGDCTPVSVQNISAVPAGVTEAPQLTESVSVVTVAAEPSTKKWRHIPAVKAQIPVEMSVGQGSAQVASPQSIKQTVQNFRNILLDIEKQQNLQAQQLKQLV